ncbi:DUF7565 family protein [Halomicrococcus sp. NG-SE-24]|uniref:DUF7565 family protein n=1 Tax=unclassified Halomicrococcus TaxID=2614448 RepID=UPI000DDFFC12|nr:hypothetical protein DMJ13_16110 [halophilic archaeon]
MSAWECDIDGCGKQFGSVEDAIVHQTTEHERQECAVCGAVVPDGYFAIRHAFDEHSRAEYVRSYDADSNAVRVRERVRDDVEESADLKDVVERLDELDGGELP